MHAYQWIDLPSELNVADFDTVILNFAAFEDEAVRRTVPLDRLPPIQQFMRLLFSPDSFVIAIGDPRCEFGSDDGDGSSREATWWLPVDLPVHDESGEVISNIDAGWAFWFEHVRGFRWHFGKSPRPSENAAKYRNALRAIPAGARIAANWEPLAETRYEAPVGVELTLSALTGETGRTVVVAAQSNAIPWLPPSTQLDQHEAIELLLLNIGVRVEAARPGWLSAYRLPRQMEADRDVETKEAALMQRRLICRRQSHARRPKRAFRSSCMSRERMLWRKSFVMR